MGQIRSYTEQTTLQSSDVFLMQDGVSNVTKKTQFTTMREAVLSPGGSGAWTSYTPVWTAAGTAPAIGNGTIVGKYMQIGKTVTARILITMGSTTTYGTGQYFFTLPSTAAAGEVLAEYAPVGTFMSLSAGGFYFGQAVIVQATKLLSGLYHSITTAGQTVNIIGATTPFTYANTNNIQFKIVYEAA